MEQRTQVTAEHLRTRYHIRRQFQGEKSLEEILSNLLKAPHLAL